MTRREILLNIAAENDIEFVDYPCGEKEALLCIIPWGGAKIGIDYAKIKSPADEIVKMAHELGRITTLIYRWKLVSAVNTKLTHGRSSSLSLGRSYI